MTHPEDQEQTKQGLLLTNMTTASSYYNLQPQTDKFSITCVPGGATLCLQKCQS